MVATDNGLSSKEAAARLALEGPNDLPAEHRHSIWKIAREVLYEPMFSLLLGAGFIYFLIGDTIEAVVLSLFCLLSVVIVIAQEWRSERVLETLRDLSSPRALVIRDGVTQRIASREVVRGDILLLEEGDRISADAKIISNDVLYVDESHLTGESMPVEKKTNDNIFAGTLIVQGSAKALTLLTGIHSKLGDLGQTLKSINIEAPQLQIQVKNLIKLFAGLSLVLSVTCVILYRYMRHDWANGILSGLALGMALLPEEFPLVLTVFLAMGAWRISKIHVLTRKASAIETLGSATVLSTDKTGTLTENKMLLAVIKSGRESWSQEKLTASPEILSLLAAAQKACKENSYDPMDFALLQCPLSSTKSDSKDNSYFHYGLKPNLMMVANAYKEEKGYSIFAKGAPETVIRVSHLGKNEQESIRKDIEELASQGMRVLAVAQASYSGDSLPEAADEFDYQFLGLLGFLDPLRKEIPAAVAECRSAGIRIIMITGDHAATAHAIAHQAGLDADSALTGHEIEQMTDEELAVSVKKTSIFARVSPNQKLRIINALKKNGEIVAMIGDGVNDAPSLKAAHIGVAMGARGTDVAREASSIVLLEDSFSSLVKTFALGRRINDNLRKAMVYITAIHVPIASLALFPFIFNTPLILTPLIIALLEMIVDPACSIVLEAEKQEENTMNRPPRRPGKPLLPYTAVFWGFFQGLCVLMFVGGWFVTHYQTTAVDTIRTFVFISLVLLNLVLILVNRSFSSSFKQAVTRGNKFLFGGVLIIGTVFGFLLSIPSLRGLFHLGPISWHDIIYIVVFSVMIFLLLEAVKKLVKKAIFE